MNQSTEEFFNEIGDQYDAAILRCVPRYHEMLDSMLDYLEGFPGFRNQLVADNHPVIASTRILELGCGSGNLTAKILNRFPGCDLTVVDSSEKMLALVGDRFQEKRLVTRLSLFQDLEFSAGEFDLITSSISIHHLTDDQKQELFTNVRHWLSDSGVFTFCDQFRGATEGLYEKHLRNWKQSSFGLGADQAEWDTWMEHQNAHDYHSSLETHWKLLKNAGFETIDCTRRYILWTTIIAGKNKNKQDALGRNH